MLVYLCVDQRVQEDKLLIASAVLAYLGLISIPDKFDSGTNMCNN